MRRGGHGYRLQVPWRQHDDPIPSSTPFEQLEGWKFRLVIALVGFSTAILIFVWNSKQVVSRSDLPPKTLPGLVFPLYSHNYIQSPNESQDETWHQGNGTYGRRRRTLSHPFFGLKPENRAGRERFYIEMKLGIQAKLFNFIIDTGSGSTWVNCKLPSRKANVLNLGPHGYFEPRKLETIKCNGKDKELCHKYQQLDRDNNIPCDARHNFDCLAWLSYIDGSSYKGSYIWESFTLPTLDKMEVKGQGVLGCITEETELSGSFKHFADVCDGLLGLGVCEGTIISDWMESKLITNKRIGICIGQANSRQPSVSRIDNGYVTIGVNLQEKFGVNHFGWAELENTEGFDCAVIATLNYITFGGKTYYPPTTSGLPLALDTGGPLTKLDKWFYDKLFDDDTTTSPLDNFPTLTFCMKGKPDSIHLDPIQCLIVQPRNYLDWKEDERLLCLNILKVEQLKEDQYMTYKDYIDANKEPPGESIIAVAQMRGLLMEVDPDNYRVRWKPDPCDF